MIFYILTQDTTLSILLCIAGFVLSILTLQGCQFARVHFNGPEGMDHIYFSPRNYLGVGFYNHQDLERNILSDWTKDESCYPYTDWESEKFKTPNFRLSRNSSVAAAVFGALALCSLIGLKIFYRKVKKSNVVFLPFMLVAIACMLQWAGVTMFFEGTDEICDENRYGMIWNYTYPHTDYPDYSKFSFFSHCSIGPKGNLAVIAAALYGAATFLLTVCMCCENAFPEDVSKEVDEEAVSASPSADSFEEERTKAIPQQEVFRSSSAKSVKSAISVLKGTMIEEESDEPKTYDTVVGRAYTIDPLAIEVGINAVDANNKDSPSVKESKNDDEDEDHDDISYEQSERMDLEDDISMDPSSAGESKF